MIYNKPPICGLLKSHGNFLVKLGMVYSGFTTLMQGARSIIIIVGASWTRSTHGSDVLDIGSLDEHQL